MPEQTYSFQLSQEPQKLKGIYGEIDLPKYSPGEKDWLWSQVMP
jgi:hypothetical protein